MSSFTRVLNGSCIGILVTLLPLAAADLRVGRAKVVITPPVGAVMGNSYGNTVSTGVSSDVHAKAVVFETGGVKAAVVLPAQSSSR